MKDIALQVARERPSLGLHALREYIQNYVLWLMQREGLNTRLFFMGGTALRFLWRIGRYSEDLDFSAGPLWEPEEFPGAMRKIESGLTAAGYDVNLHLRKEKTVQRAVFRFFDLFWFLSKWPDLEPNPLMFRNALAQERNAVREGAGKGAPGGGAGRLMGQTRAGLVRRRIGGPC